MTSTNHNLPCPLLLGFGAMWLVGGKRILAAPGARDSAVPLLADKLGGTLLFGTVAVVAGLTITASASFAHDVVRRPRPPPARR